MTMTRICTARIGTGRPCQAAPLRDGDYCLLHDPERADAVQKARREGGRRRKREAQVATVYDFKGLDSIEDIKRLVEVAVIDTLALPSSLQRSRTLAYLAHTATKLFEKGQIEERVAAIEAALLPRLAAVRQR